MSKEKIEADSQPKELPLKARFDRADGGYSFGTLEKLENRITREVGERGTLTFVLRGIEEQESKYDGRFRLATYSEDVDARKE
jgi:hypothetical protein